MRPVLRSAAWLVPLGALAVPFDGPAEAAFVQNAFRAAVGGTTGGDPFGLTGQTLDAMAIYDDIFVLPGLVSVVSLGADAPAGTSLSITLGSFSFDASDDVDFGTGNPAPTLSFDAAGAFLSLDFFGIVTTPANVSLDIDGSGFFLDELPLGDVSAFGGPLEPVSPD